MKALSIQQPWANLILDGLKIIETRVWETSYRGDILICASKKIAFVPPIPLKTEPRGVAICIAELYDIQKMTRSHEEAAMCEIYPGAYSWFLRNIRPVEPFPVKGQLRLFEVEV